MSLWVTPQISFQFDFENPEQWNAHARRDFIENLSEEFQKISTQILSEMGEKSGVSFDQDQRLGRVHTPWLGESHTRVVFQPNVPSVLVEQATHESKNERERFQKSLMGRATLWLAQKVSGPDQDGLKEVEQNLLDKKLAQVSANWSAHLIDPIVRKLGGWVAQYGHDGVDVQVITPHNTVKLKIQAFPL